MRSPASLLPALLIAGGANAQSPTAPWLLPAPSPAAEASAPAPTTRALGPAHRVALAGRMGNQALLIIDGGPPRALAVGASYKGVRLLGLEPEGATVDIDGQRRTLRIGESALSFGGAPSPGGGTQISLSSDARGHFLAPGQINGRGVSFLVDTGATLVALGREEAERLGLAYLSAPRVGLNTANGQTVGWRVALASIRIGDVEVYNVEAVVQPQPMPFVLLGNSFLTRFQMKRENDTLTLLKRY